MGLAKRIIPALDIKNGQVVKGISFDQIRAVGDPVALAKRYQEMGADELVFLDITATIEGRATMKSVVDQVSKEIFIPLTVGGGIRSVDEMTSLIQAGADKIFLNSAAVKDPGLVTAGAQVFGAQAMVGAIDAKWDSAKGFYRVYVAGGTKPTELDAIKWAQELVQAGAGELLVTSIDADGQKKGYDLRLYQQLAAAVDVPIIASGGAGTTKDFVDVFADGSVDAALAASVFHYNQIAIPDLKRDLKEKQVEVRL
ncbi:imidazole glycerol phosphate synthase subunit HisF [Fructobacillus evanidus]|uniref:Imidazole glycerol phosphate synthase subunit HisF n=1 Tax=Fructobacillus evanidus TaxID=3064281 RepID=A0ABM9MWB3_9LACO|nr:Imidazole glycerol phosphate synthase subunit HisF (HisF) [Fructobacillus sp. LMG 32999]CAK1229315.1 Imidazole glycerol phosphate synthase subunit HisF (HisF) [Fructobacillus sp. LMG 32999]CAK1232157.1 Imidazole glycerol phosphate synthase subunit HisF (HisF) [Fructobacillus sp. LMG 32999]CAK1232266.1 Imidazole glycerol phosphate synthase subunit HisF (HisF) [Fructobacillus sp. LMG 32999]CAK1233376.1 Imidazole glycerol phosphate synthase subunit HisF (HisF) [Fructobacillus sp. LMG 32999]